MLRYFTFCTCLCFGAIVNAEGIHKCVTTERTVYQGSPCPGAEAPLSIAVAPAVYAVVVPDPPPVRGCETAGGPPPRPPWRHGAICIGVSDDEVLNLPGWGRPVRIVRKRVQGGWQEEWTYETRAATLRFINARLATLEASPAQMLVASASPTQQ